MVGVNVSRFGNRLVNIGLVHCIVALGWLFPQIIAAQNNPLLPYFQDGYWGYVNANLKWIIQPQFLVAYPFNEGIAQVKLDTNTHNLSGWQLLAPNGAFLLSQPADNIQFLGNKLFAVWQNAKMGVYNAAKTWVLQPEFINTTEEGTQLKDSLLCVRTLSGCGIISLSGEWILSPKYQSIVIHTGQIAELIDNKSSCLYHLSRKEVIIDSVEAVGEFAFNRLPVRKGKLWGFLDTAGNWVQKPMYAHFFSFSESLAAVLYQGSWGFLDTAGNWAIPPKYQLVRSFSEGKAAVKSSEKWGFINNLNEWIIEPTYAEAFSFREKLALVKFQQKWYFLNPNGFTPIQLNLSINAFVFTPSSGFKENYFLFQNENGKYQFLAKNGLLLTTYEFDYAEPFYNGLALIRIDNQNLYLTNKGTILR